MSWFLSLYGSVYGLYCWVENDDGFWDGKCGLLWGILICFFTGDESFWLLENRGNSAEISIG